MVVCHCCTYFYHTFLMTVLINILFCNWPKYKLFKGLLPVILWLTLDAFHAESTIGSYATKIVYIGIHHCLIKYKVQSSSRLIRFEDWILNMQHSKPVTLRYSYPWYFITVIKDYTLRYILDWVVHNVNIYTELLTPYPPLRWRFSVSTLSAITASQCSVIICVIDWFTCLIREVKVW